MAELNKDEVCIAYDIEKGKELWTTKLGKTIFEKSGGNGPRVTPTVVDGRVYVYGSYLNLSCLDAKTGKILWQHDVQNEFNGQNETKGIKAWGNAQSVIVDGDAVMVAGGGAGQSFLIFDRITGKLRSMCGSDLITHGTPTLTTINDQRQVIFLTQSGLVSYKNDGTRLWNADFPWAVSSAISPIMYQNKVYISAGYGTGAGTFEIKREGNQWQATAIWRLKGKLENHWSTPIIHNGYLYGLYGFKQYNTMPIKCIELATGKEMWSEDGFGQGGTILIGDKVMILGDQGQLVLINASPDKYTEVARAQVLTKDCWNNPAVANGFVVCRSKTEITCLDLRVKEAELSK
jgi:outer membrane protein assembly factor BamB